MSLSRLVFDVVNKSINQSINQSINLFHRRSRKCPDRYWGRRPPKGPSTRPLLCPPYLPRGPVPALARHYCWPQHPAALTTTTTAATAVVVVVVVVVSAAMAKVISVSLQTAK